MPKKRQGQALLIKPGSSVSSSNSTNRHNESSGPSVNDLIRESRRLQFRNEPTTSSTVTASVPPQVRQALNLPVPEAPPPRPGTRTGPARFRRIPGPPPPRSWLIDSRHAPKEVRDHVLGSARLQKRTSNLPGIAFPSPFSLQHFALKELAVKWDWHVQYDGEYLADLPIKLREALLSYLVVYGDKVQANALRRLFMTDMAPESRAEVTRLDLTEAVGAWTTLKQLEKDLGPVVAPEVQAIPNHEVPDTWDDNADTSTPSTALSRIPSGVMFKNLQHVSLALHPRSTATASWKDLIHLAEKIPTITSLSLANWPTPTYTPRAASTRVLVQSPSSRPSTVYGGTNFYTAFDNDWREAAGILRSLSRTLYCLEWLDLTGCGSWFPALTWTPVGDRNPEGVGPEWNGWWRGIEHVRLAVGWEPIEPEIEEGEEDHHKERKMVRHAKEKAGHAALEESAQKAARELRALRKKEGGKWIHFEF